MKKFEYNFDIYNKFKFNFEKWNFSRLNSFEFESIRITTLKLLQTRIMTAQNKEEFSKATSIFNENADVDECNLIKLAEKKLP